MRVGSHDGRRTIHLRRLREIPAASYLSQHVERRMSVGRCSQLVHIPSGQLAKKNRPPGCCPCSNTFLINSNDALGLDGNVTVYWTLAAIVHETCEFLFSVVRTRSARAFPEASRNPNRSGPRGRSCRPGCPNGQEVQRFRRAELLPTSTRDAYHQPLVPCSRSKLLVRVRNLEAI